MTGQTNQSISTNALPAGEGAVSADEIKSMQPDRKPGPSGKHQATRWRRSISGVVGVLILAAALWFGIPWVRLTLNTESTDDAFVNGHVTFVAARVHGQVSRVLVDDNNHVHKGDVLIELDKEPFQDAVAVKRAAVDTAKADLQAATAQVHGIEAQARSRRWNLQHAMENVDNQIALLHARVAEVDKSKAELSLAELDFERARQLLPTSSIPRAEYDRRQTALSVARAQVTQALADVYQIRASLGLTAQPEAGADLETTTLSSRTTTPPPRLPQPPTHHDAYSRPVVLSPLA